MTSQDSTVSWVADTAEALNLAKNANEAQKQIVVFEDASASFNRLLSEFRELAAGASVLRSYGWLGRGASPELLDALQESAKTLGSRPLTRSVSALERFKSDVKDALIEHWSQHAAEQLGDVTELSALAATLGDVEGIADLSGRLQAVLGELARTQRDVPSKRSVEKLQEAESALRQLEESLQPEAVRRFLSAVARGGASLEFLSKDVSDWLNSHHALRGFKVVAGSPSDQNDD